MKRAAGLANLHDTTLWRIEKARTVADYASVEALCAAYEANERTRTALLALATQAHAQGWWHAYGDVIPDWFSMYLPLEAGAAEAYWYESEIIPGLLQTEDYARVVMGSRISAEHAERRVRARLARRSILSREQDPLTLKLALSEAVLHRPVGGRRLMAAQLRDLAVMTALPNVSIRVVPFSAGLHEGITSGPFVLLRFGAAGDEPPIVYNEALTGSLYLDKSNEIKSYATAFGNIWKVCLDEEASGSLLSQAARELEDEQIRLV